MLQLSLTQAYWFLTALLSKIKSNTSLIFIFIEETVMTQAIDKEQIIIDEVKKLPPDKLDEVIDFIQFLQYKEKKKQDVEHKEEKEPISAYEAAKEFAGCVDGGPGDLATNKKYLEGYGWK